MDSVRFKPAPLQFPEEDPFKDDLFKDTEASRKASAEILTEFVGSLDEPFVLAIDSPFGTGKTTFLRMWRPFLRKEGFACLEFHAWENDFSESPLVSLLGELGAGIESLRLESGQRDAVQKVLEKTKKVGASLVKTALPAAVKLATYGLLDLSQIAEGELAGLAENIAKEQIEKYQADKKTITSFRNELRELVKSLGPERGEGKAKPVVFVIDELDRCRPPYAIELLEKVKHLFFVDGLVFVLAIDRHQLSESVKALYGSGMDADGYLRRFIDLEYRLPEPDSKKFAEAQFARFGLGLILAAKVGDVRHEGEHLIEILPQLLALFAFSLRTQEQCFTQLSIVLRTTPPDFYLYSYLLALLICLRAANRKLYFRW